MKTKYDGMLTRCNSESVSVGERLYCGVSFLLCILSQYLRLRETAEGLNREARKFERQLSGVLHSGNSRSDSLLSELLGVTSTPSPVLLKQYNLERDILTQEETILSQYLAAFAEVRKALLRLETRNRIQSELQSLLRASEPNGDKWAGRICERDSLAVRHSKQGYKVGVIAGGVVRVVSAIVYRKEPLSVSRFLSVPVVRSLFNRKSNKGGSVNRKRGERLWERNSASFSLSAVDRDCFKIGDYLDSLSFTATDWESLSVSVDTLRKSLLSKREALAKVESLNNQEQELCKQLQSQRGSDYESERETTLASLSEVRAERAVLASKYATSGYYGKNSTARSIVGDIVERTENQLSQELRKREFRREQAERVERLSLTLKNIGSDFQLITASVQQVNSYGVTYNHNRLGSGKEFNRASLSLTLAVRRLLSCSATQEQNRLYPANKVNSLLSLAALRKLSEVSTPCKVNVTQLVVSRPVSLGLWEFTVSEQRVSLPVVAVPVLTLCSGQLQTQISFGRTGESETDSLLSCCSTYHTERAVENLEFDTDSPLFDILQSNLNSATREWERKKQNEIDKREAIRKQRAETASLALKLRRVETVSLEDSFQAGNCKVGTAEFCSKWGIETQIISGSELARKWWKSGWEQNYMFLRVVRSVVGRSAVVNSGVAK
ncbi:MAG: hypothetical protein EBU53_02165 [Proteobacteria bacterium]|nr:hypothetical protein [Pseudomonadota bacterium]